MYRATAGERATKRYPRTILVPNPAAGAEWSATVPGGHLYTLMTISATLTTSAVAASRRPRLVVTDGNSTLVVIPSQVAETASLAWVNSWVPLSAAYSDGLYVVQPIPPMVLDMGAVIRTSTALIDVGDQWSGIVLSVIDEVIVPGRRDVDDTFDVEIAGVNPALYNG